MKKLVQVTLFCMNYIYTGAFNSDKFSDAQKLPNNLYVRINSIECYSVLDKK